VFPRVPVPFSGLGGLEAFFKLPPLQYAQVPNRESALDFITKGELETPLC